MDSFGIVTIIPFVAAMFFLIWQEDTILPLLGGLILGGFMLSRFNPLLGLYTVASELIFESLLNSRNISILAVIVAALILFTLLKKNPPMDRFQGQARNHHTPFKPSHIYRSASVISSCRYFYETSCPEAGAFTP